MGCCEYRNEILDYTHYGKFIYYLKNYYQIHNDSSPWSYLVNVNYMYVVGMQITYQDFWRQVA